jgi:DNA modification methylase
VTKQSHIHINHGSALEKLKDMGDACIQLAITSPPYYKTRDYQVDGQIGWESSVLEYINKLADIFDEVKRVLKPTGSLWVNIADKIDNKSLMRIPEKLCIEMEQRGWFSPQTIIWNKPNGMPAGGGNSIYRFNIDFEYFYHFAKTPSYYFKQQYERLNEVTLKELEKVYTGVGAKDYEENDVQNPSDVKRRVLKGLYKFGGNKSKGYGPGKYSGKEYNPKQIPLSEEDRSSAMKLGWDGESDYAEWYFNVREKRGFHDHSSNELTGFSHQGRGQGKVKLVYPYGSIKRAVWRIPHANYPDAHFATFPEPLVETPIKACSQPEDIVLDPFMGSGTVGLVALQNARNFVGIELNKEYITLAYKRLDAFQGQTRLV